MADVRAANRAWFGPKNKRFFGDHWYKLRKGRATGRLYLLRYTDGWSDMFGGKPRPFFVLNHVDPQTLQVDHMVEREGSTLHREFRDMDQVNDWLREN
jgi:hypothetical protein